MAFYLRRRYGESPDVRVFNDLRVERDGEVAQMDHLLLHQHGMIIIESKSVTGEVHINSQLEFMRVFGRKRTGMASPIQQAHRQGELLRRLLIDHKESLRRRRLLGLVQSGFQACPIQVLVAISDQGIIRRPKQDVPELHKADQIVDAADAIIERHRRGARLTGPNDGDWGLDVFHPDELERVTTFLLERHCERDAPAPAPSSSPSASSPPLPSSPTAPRAPTSPPPPTPKEAIETTAPRMPDASCAPSMPTFLCTHCHSTNLEVRYGRSYYFKCLDCDGNTGIRNECRACGQSTKTRKRGPEFTAVCRSCGDEALFFINREAASEGDATKS